MKHLPRLAQRDWIGLSLALAGLTLRLRQYLVNRSLWLDEAMLANNILARDVVGLFRPLDDDQGAPIGFLLLQKLVTSTLGDSEYALRLIPFLAGCLALVLMFLLTKKISSAFAGNLALAFFVFSPSLIYYSSEVKQYSSDVAIALALTLLFLQLERTAFRRNAAVLLAFAGALALWISHPALFVVAALGLVLFIQAARQRDRRRIASLLLIALVWWLSLGALYLVNLRQLSTHAFFLDYWRDGFMPRGFSAFGWLVDLLRAPFTDLLGLQLPYLVSGPFFLVGMIALTRRRPHLGLFLLLIFFLTLLASFLTLYPFAGRMILFLAPILCLLLAEGAEAVSSLFFSRPAWLWWIIRFALAGAFIFAPFSLACETFTAPKMREHIRPAMEYLREHHRDGDLVYLYYWAEHAVRFYAPKYGFEMSDFIIGADHHSNPERYRADLDALRGRERVWVLFSHVYQDGDFNERDFILEYLDSIGKLSREIRFPGTSVYLYLYDLQ